jgi:hypothetical protein
MARKKLFEIRLDEDENLQEDDMSFKTKGVKFPPEAEANLIQFLKDRENRVHLITHTWDEGMEARKKNKKKKRL